MSAGTTLEAVEEGLSEIWAEVLGRERVGIEDDFFRLGGNSLAAVQIAARASAAFGADVPLDAVFQARTVGAFARVVEAIAQTAPPARAPPPIRHHDEPSEREAAIWAWPHYGGPNLLGSSAYRLEGPLDVPTLERAFTELVRRHEILRTTYPADQGRPRIEVLEPHAVRVRLVDVSGDPADERERRLREEIARERSEPLDYHVTPPLRVGVVRLSAQSHVLLIAVHEIICDGQGLVPLMGDLSLLYDALAAGGPSPFTAPALQYRDAIHMQRGADAHEGRRYWERTNAERPVAVRLPVRPEGPLPASVEGPVAAAVELAPELVARLKSIAQDAAATPFMAYLAAFFALLNRYSGATRLVVRSPAANRTTVELEQVVGMFARVVPIGVDLPEGISFRALIAAARDAALPAFRYCNQMPLHEPVLHASGARGLSERLPVFRLHERPEPVPTLAGIRTTQLDDDWPTSALTMDVTEHGPDAPAAVTLASHLGEIDQQGLTTMADHYRRLIERMVDDPDRSIDAIALADERSSGPRPTAPDAVADPPACLHTLVEQRARAHPDAPAIRSRDGVLRYGELDARAEALAARLRARGLAPQARAGLLLEPSTELVVAMLAVLKAGATCVPLEPGRSAERVEPPPDLDLLLVHGATRGEAPATQDVLDISAADPPPGAERPARGEREIAVQPGQIAFAIRTAGVTGPRRTIPLTHALLAGLVAWQRTTYELTAADVALHAPGPGVLTWALAPWPLLASGGQVVVPEPPPGAAGDATRSTLEGHVGVTVAALSPEEASRHLAEASADRVPPRLLLVQGHGALALPADVEQRGTRILRQYAVAEAGGAVLVEAAGRSTGPWIPVTASSPAAVRGEVRVVDAHGQPLPAGVVGELSVDGRPTGDLGCRFADGAVQFVGRAQDRVQLRGFDLNPAMDELEATLARQSRIRAAIACWDEASASLVVAIVPKAEPPTARELDRQLRHHTSSRILPARYVVIDAVPRRPDGSPDRRALTASAAGIAQAPIEAAAPGGRTQKRLLRLCKKLLGRRDLDVGENFFGIGGTLVLGVELAARAQRAGVPLTPQMLLAAPTIGELVDLVEQSQDHEPTNPAHAGAASR